MLGLGIVLLTSGPSRLAILHNVCPEQDLMHNALSNPAAINFLSFGTPFTQATHKSTSSIQENPPGSLASAIYTPLTG